VRDAQVELGFELDLVNIDGDLSAGIGPPLAES